jgi:extracellular factor (EF) 3-hydroxypalmitic acid methyl ester biosynthesis protein
MSKTVKFKTGEKIITKGDKALTAYVIKSGKVQVFLEKGGKTVTLGELGPGAMFGETSLFGGAEYGANVKAAEDTELELITPASFKEKIDASDPMLRSIILMLMERQRKTNEALLKSETREFMEIAFI